MAALPYIQFYIADYLADTAHLTTEQHGAYLLLIFNYWQRGQALNNANERLASVARMSNDVWETHKQTLAEFFEIDGDLWISRRIDDDLEAVSDKSCKASTAGRASGAKRRAERKRTLNGRSTHVERTLNHTDTEADTEADKEQDQEQRGANAPRKVSEPLTIPDWLPSEAWDEWYKFRNTRKGWTPYARKLSLGKLTRLHASGNDPTAVIEQSIESGWTGLFPVKNEINHGNHQASRRESVAERASRFAREGNEADARRAAANQDCGDASILGENGRDIRAAVVVGIR